MLYKNRFEAMRQIQNGNNFFINKANHSYLWNVSKYFTVVDIESNISVGKIVILICVLIAMIKIIFSIVGINISNISSFNVNNIRSISINDLINKFNIFNFIWYGSTTTNLDNNNNNNNNNNIHMQNIGHDLPISVPLTSTQTNEYFDIRIE